MLRTFVDVLGEEGRKIVRQQTVCGGLVGAFGELRKYPQQIGFGIDISSLQVLRTVYSTA
jgi:hypothetical protein